MLTWIRTQDGTFRGKPCFDYNATGKDGCKYSITWACDHGGTFGYTAYDPAGKALTTHWGGGICWVGTLGRCKDACNEIEDLRAHPVRLPEPAIPEPTAALVPNWAGEFRSFDDWVRRATRLLADKYCESSTCGYSKGGIPAMCVDTKGRRCYQGSDFMRARDEGCFPVRFFWDCKVEE